MSTKAEKHTRQTRTCIFNARMRRLKKYKNTKLTLLNYMKRKRQRQHAGTHRSEVNLLEWLFIIENNPKGTYTIFSE